MREERHSAAPARDGGRDSVWGPVFLFWLLIAAVYVFVGYEKMGGALGDTDIAMRLVQLQEFLRGRGWYDLSIPRLAPAEGYVSHWSRLMDAALAALLSFYSLFLPPAEAELALRLTWPLLMLLPAMAAVTWLAVALAGRGAAFLAAGLVALSLPARFYVGDIDHHGIQIALMMLAWALLMAPSAPPWAAFGSGVMVMFTLAIGLEALPLLLPLSLAAALPFLLWGRPEDRALLSRHMGGLLAGSLFFLALAVPPARWLSANACDAFAPNWALPVAAAALVILLLVRMRPETSGPAARAGVLLAAAAVAAGLFVLMDPACLRGPFAHMDPRLRPVWLMHVKEIQPLWSAGVHGGFKGVWLWALVVAIAAAVAFARRWRDVTGPGAGREGRDVPAAGDLASPPAGPRARAMWAVYLATLLLALGLSLKAMRYSPFAQWLALPLAAWLVHGMLARLGRLSGVLRVPVLLLCSPLAFALAYPKVAEALPAPDAGQPKQTAQDSRAEQQKLCRSDSALRGLNGVPPGLIATTIDMGPFVLARTHHYVLAAPYHRLGESMLAVSRIFASPPAQARKILRELNVRYVLYCEGLVPPRTLSGERPGRNTLWAALAGSRPPEWLKPVDLGSSPLRLYRVTAATDGHRKGARAPAKPGPSLRLRPAAE
jgi:hypothetical protein